jgi:hypothetical protein
MTWAQRLKRVFKIDIETCEHCGSAVKMIACIEDPVVGEIRGILAGYTPNQCNFIHNAYRSRELGLIAPGAP